MRSSWVSAKERADRCTPDVERIIRLVAGDIVEVSATGEQDDREFGRDYRVLSGWVAARIRTPDKWRWRGEDITIRTSRPRSGYLTELDKILRGDVQWMLSGWTPDDERVPVWIFTDLARLVDVGLHLRGGRHRNTDGSSEFIDIPSEQIVEAGALVACDVDQPTRLHRLTHPAPAPPFRVAHRPSPALLPLGQQ